ncbi:hypothetical protein GXW82_02755 [Streptacidiphilus sp. 4-A2]|nr:hypothetical protein [Streptacidiphilus sp. 4-A2]
MTGASGALGGLVARHLAESGGVERLLLLSRRGVGAGGVARLAAELAVRCGGGGGGCGWLTGVRWRRWLRPCRPGCRCGGWCTRPESWTTG